MRTQLATPNPVESCPACGSPTYISVGVTSRGFGGLKCSECGLVRTHPMPDTALLNEFYQGFDFQKPDTAEIPRLLPRIERSLEHFVGRAQPGARFLDFGGASGIYCLGARNLGYDPFLFDLDSNMIDFARIQLKLERATTKLEEVPEGVFDVIFSYHVIEHSNDLGSFLETMRRLLKPGGKLVLATPSAENVEKYVRIQHLARYWLRLTRARMSVLAALRLVLQRNSIFCWDPPRHLFAFTGASMQSLMERHGWEAKIQYGYCCDPLFDPRQYITPPLSSVLAGPGRRVVRNAITWAEGVALRPVSWIVPGGGEQLYCTARLKE